VMIWRMFNGEVPEGMVVDHKDQNKAHKKIQNLRLLSKGQNNLNTNRKGVSYDSKRHKWRAQTSIDDKTHLF
jgi:hypothetical protein